MQCSHAQEIFSEYINDSIDKATVVSLENHLQRCSGCREDLESLRQVWHLLNESPVISPPDHLHLNIMNVWEAQTVASSITQRRTLQWRRLFRPRTLAYAFAAIVILVGGAEVVQTERAELGPISYIRNLVAPTPQVKLQTLSAEWTPNENGGGMLKLNLKADRVNSTDAHLGGVAFMVHAPGPPESRAQGRLPGGQVVQVQLDVAKAPVNGALLVDISLTPTGAVEKRTRIWVPLNSPSL